MIIPLSKEMTSLKRNFDMMGMS